MSQDKTIPVVDLFAGPGGLGEGFSAFNEGNTFRTLVSAEMDSSAHETLRLRAFYRILKRQGGNALDSYYKFCHGESVHPCSKETIREWEEAENEAKQITLGTAKGNQELNSTLDKARLGHSDRWVLIGGPPCQAYSLVGRSRNRGNIDYRAEDDHRHFLYKEYLKIIHQYQPPVFVMENVKGILSSTMNGNKIFHTILRDLSNPQLAIENKKSGQKYKIYSLVVPTVFEHDMDPENINLNNFIIRAESYGIPQARHRVILLGVREDLGKIPTHLEKCQEQTVLDAIADLPPLRSKLSKEEDSSKLWALKINHLLKKIKHEASKKPELHELVEILKKLPSYINHDLGLVAQGRNLEALSQADKSILTRWYHDERLEVWLNHESRGHMASDLGRYLYASAFAAAYGRSPKGHLDFSLNGLQPNHKNWETGKFSDRFRVQLSHRPATTVTSHIAKDGHYYIHPDPSQCRSLTAREAARLQTFPDNYFFQGNRTQQLHQVGNAVPPLLAYKIASVVHDLIA